MKTTLKIIGILFILIIAAAIALPFLFKGQLSQLAREEINRNLKARVGFGDITLTIFKSFPNFTLGLKDLSVVGVAPFEGDTLAFIPSLDITVDLFSVIKGTTYQVKRIAITSPSVKVIILEDGQANYDIALPEGDDQQAAAPEDSAEGDFTLSLQQIEVRDAYLRYDDRASGMVFSASRAAFDLSGDLTADMTTLRTRLDIADMDLVYGGIPYFSNTHVVYDAEIQADLLNEIYTLKKNSLALNELFLSFDGSVSMIGDDINIVMAFNTQRTEFKTLLSLIPAIYARDFQGLEASGKFRLTGNVKGLYNEENLPSFSLEMEVDDGQFHYPELPQSVREVRLRASVINSGGDADNTVVDLSQLHAVLGSNPVDMSMKVRTPVSDPEIDGEVKGKLDLSTIGDFYPLEAGEALSGIVVADVTLQGRLSDVENENYDAFTAIGSLLMQNLEYTSGYTGQPVKVSKAQLNFSPQYLDLVSFACTIGENDLAASGKITSYLGYLLSDGTLSGSLETRSQYMDINSLMMEETDEQEADATVSDSVSLEVIEIPGNIDFELKSAFNTLIYDTYKMENVNGRLTIRDRQLTIGNLSMNILDGEMVLNGSYSTADPGAPAFDLNLDIRDLDIQSAYQTFGIMKEYAPVAGKTKGRFSSTLSMASTLDQEMMPVYETMTGGGKLQTSSLRIEDLNTLDRIAEALKYEPLKNLSIEKILIQFEFVDGKILIEPFDFRQQDISGTMAGWTGLDQTIDYTMNLNIPRNKFGQAANSALDNLVSQANSKGAAIKLGETVSLGVLIGGTLTDPKISTNLKESGKDLVEDVKKQVEDEIRKQKEELTEKAKEEARIILEEADKQAALLQEEARKQAKAIRDNAAQAAKKVKDEAEKQAGKIEAEGKKKGFLAEAAAKETAKQVRKEADKQAGNIIDEADKQADAVTKKADDEAARIKQEARKEADRILGKI